MKHDELTQKIIGCAYQVYNNMGSGYLESVYEKCLMIELKKSGLCASSQKPIQVTYDGEIVGDFIADLVIEDTVIVELKAIRQLATLHEVQLVNYLTATNTEVGLLINFGPTRVEVKRKMKTLPSL
ncbi:MAG: GxxExxY protein [Pirellulaceae bacterium]